jgi:hypothetical protein
MAEKYLVNCYHRDKLIIAIELNKKVVSKLGKGYLIFEPEALLQALLGPEEITDKLLSNPKFENKVVKLKDIKEAMR